MNLVLLLTKSLFLMTDETYLWLNADVSNLLLINRLFKLKMKLIL